MQIPNNWSEIKLYQFLELTDLNDKGYSDDEKNMEIFSILSNLSFGEIEELDYDTYNELLISLDWIKQLPTKQPKSHLKINSLDFYLFDDFNQLTFGEYIDLEVLFDEGYNKNLDIILSILYRQKTIINNPLYKDEFEPYGNWIYHRRNLFHEECIQNVYGVIAKYSSFKQALIKTYEGLFLTNIESEDNIDEETDLEEISKRKDIDKKQEISKKWGWDIWLYKLAKNDPLKIEEATKMPLLQALNVLSMCKELDIQ